MFKIKAVLLKISNKIINRNGTNDYERYRWK